MPLDEKQKQELLKMIEEQRKAILTGKSSTKSRYKKTKLKTAHYVETNNIINSHIEEPTEVTLQKKYGNIAEGIKYAVKKKSEIASKLNAELRKTTSLNWKLTLAVIISLIAVMMIGVIIGYIFAYINITKYS